MAISTIGTDALASAAVTSAKLASGAPSRSQLPAGTVLQVINNYSDSGYNLSAVGSGGATVGPTQLTNFNVTITPTSASSKIAIFVTMGSVGFANTSNNNSQLTSMLYRNSTPLTYANVTTYGYNNTYTTHSLMWVDSPNTTSAVTYYVYGKGSGSTAGEYAWNRVTPSATMVVAMEIAA